MPPFNEEPSDDDTQLSAPDRLDDPVPDYAHLELDPDTERAWDQIAAKRQEELENGTVLGLTLEEVLSRARARLRR